jgi:hypothetical protein
LLFPIAVLALFCLCKKTVHDAETRLIPKVLRIKTNIKDAVPDLKIRIRTSFKSLPESWYCQHYGSGAGTMSWYIEDTINVSDYSHSIDISLRLNKKTYCPYVLHGVFISFLQNNKRRPNAGISFWTKEENPNVKWSEIPEIIKVGFLKDSLGCFFPEYAKGLLHFLIPEKNVGVLNVNVQFGKMQIER